MTGVHRIASLKVFANAHWSKTTRCFHKFLLLPQSYPQGARMWGFSFSVSSPIIITHIRCRSLLQIFIESPSYAIHSSRHSFSESDSKAGHGEEKEDRGGQGMEASQIDRVTQKISLAKTCKTGVINDGGFSSTSIQNKINSIKLSSSAKRDQHRWLCQSYYYAAAVLSCDDATLEPMTKLCKNQLPNKFNVFLFFLF